MAGPLQLSTVARCKTWLQIGVGNANTNADALIGQLLTTMSAQIMSYLERSSFISQTYTDVVNGQGHTVQFLQNWPVTAVSDVKINGYDINYVAPTDPPYYLTPGSSYGYTWQSWDNTLPGNPTPILLLGGALFWRGYQNVQITYTAGYAQSESFTLPGNPLIASDHTIQLGLPQGIFIADNGVVNTSTTPPTPMTFVPYVSLIWESLEAGQYSIDPTTNGLYYFSATDCTNHVPITISYSFCPYAVEQALWEWMAEVYARRTRPGLRSKTLASQETMTFSSSAIPSHVQLALQPYMSVIPL